MNVPTKELVKLLGLTRLPVEERLTHKQRVTRMYKAVLKSLGDWAIYRDVWSNAAVKAQAVFRARKHEVNPLVAEQYCLEGERWLFEHRHPDPYIVPYRPGGTLYQRNEPLPAYALKDSAYLDWEAESKLEYDTEITVDREPTQSSYIWRDSFARKIVAQTASIAGGVEEHLDDQHDHHDHHEQHDKPVDSHRNIHH